MQPAGALASGPWEHAALAAQVQAAGTTPTALQKKLPFTLRVPLPKPLRGWAQSAEGTAEIPALAGA